MKRPRPSPAEWVSQLHLALLLEGVYAAPRGMLNMSTVLDDDQLDAVAARYENAFAAHLARCGAGHRWTSSSELT